MCAVQQRTVVRLNEAPIEFKGERRVNLVPSEAAPTRHLGVGLIVTPPGGGSPAQHHHGPCETGVYVLEGEAGFYCGGGMQEQVTAGPGGFMLIKPYAVHQEFNPGDTTHYIAVLRDVHGSMWFPAPVPDATPPEGPGTYAGYEGLNPTAGGALRIVMEERTVAPDGRSTLAASPRETALGILAGAPQVVGPDGAPFAGQPGQWYYVPPDTSCTVTNPPGAAPARLLVLQGPPVDAPVLEQGPDAPSHPKNDYS